MLMIFFLFSPAPIKIPSNLSVSARTVYRDRRVEMVLRIRASVNDRRRCRRGQKSSGRLRFCQRFSNILFTRAEHKNFTLSPSPDKSFFLFWPMLAFILMSANRSTNKWLYISLREISIFYPAFLQCLEDFFSGLFSPGKVLPRSTSSHRIVQAS